MFEYDFIPCDESLEAKLTFAMVGETHWNNSLFTRTFKKMQQIILMFGCNSKQTNSRMRIKGNAFAFVVTYYKHNSLGMRSMLPGTQKPVPEAAQPVPVLESDG